MPTNRSESYIIMKAAVVRSIIITGPSYWTVKLAIGCTMVVMVTASDTRLSPRSMLIVLGMYNVLRIDCCIMLPYGLQQGKEMLASIRRIKVNQ